MGIPGLTTYVNYQADIFYRNHTLHDTVLIIDGNNLASQIYVSRTVTNSAFGGDYERYMHTLQNFMTLLLSCNILPIVVFDGGYELRKLKTTCKRLCSTIRGVSSFNSVNQQNNIKLFPIFMKEVFKTVVKRLHIPCVQSDLEADFDLLYLSRKFKCPVLSYDSDFYLSDVDYIPFYGIRRKGDIKCEASSTGKGLPCKIYRVETLFRHFGGLSNEFIPLLQCMLGNDYISHIHFRSFLAELNFHYTSGKKSPVSKRLAVLIKWCRGQQTLDTALAKIMETLEFHSKNKAIEQLKQSIVEYQVEESVLYPYIMKQINESKLTSKLEELQHMMETRGRYDSLDNVNIDTSDIGTMDDFSEVENDFFNHDADKAALDYDYHDIHNAIDEDIAETGEVSTCTDSEVEIIKTEDLSDKLIIDINTKFKRHYLKIPWLVDEFRNGRLSNHIANIINIRNIYLLPLRENINLDSVHEISFDLLKYIGKILFDIHQTPFLRVYTRRLTRMRIVNLSCIDESLEEVRMENIPECDVTSRRLLLLDHLKLTHLQSSLQGDLFPEEWNLFIISLVYWCQNSEHVNICHIKSLITSFIYLNIVQTHCGYYESTSAFNRKYLKKLNILKTDIENKKIAEKKNRRKCKMSNGNQENAKENTTSNNYKPHQSTSNCGATESTNDGTDSCANVLKLVNTSSVNVDQLILLYERFFPLSHLDQKLKSNHTFFGINVIHTFCEYQSLLYFINMLNSILKFPFQEIDMSRIYSGTFLYNFYLKIFEKVDRTHILFEHSNEMYDVYQFVLKFLEKTAVSNVFDRKEKKFRRKKKRVRRKRSLGEEESEVEHKSEGDEDVLIDSDNIYSILQQVHI